MSHQPFETWLLSDQALMPDQAQALEEHLAECRSCKQFSDALMEVENLFEAVSMAQPEAGFTNRWQGRLAAQYIKDQEHKQRRLSWWFMSVSGILALLFLVLLLNQVQAVFTSPVQIVVAGMTFISQVLVLVSSIQHLLGAAVVVLAALVPPVWWIAFLAFTSMISLIWLVFLRRILIPRRSIL